MSKKIEKTKKPLSTIEKYNKINDDEALKKIRKNIKAEQKKRRNLSAETFNVSVVEDLKIDKLHINSSNKNEVEVSSNTAKLIESLRAGNHDNYTAIADIVDNSIDANATDIKILTPTENEKIDRIIIADNGIGMDKSNLINAFTLGSKSNKGNNKLGKFGLGLKTASISICKNVNIITKTKRGVFLTATFDYDKIIAKDKYIINVRNSTKNEVVFFKKFVSGSNGTVIVCSNLDKLTNKNITSFTGILSSKMSRIYRYFLDKNVKISINNNKISAQDTLMLKPKVKTLGFGKTELLHNKNHIFNIDGRKVKVLIKIVSLPLYSTDDTKTKNDLLTHGYPAMTITTQGFSIIRNGREIKLGEFLDEYKDHWYDRFRGEIHFSGDDDDLFSVDYSKTNVCSINETLKEEIKKIAIPLRDAIKKESQDQAKVNSTGIDLKKYSKSLTSKLKSRKISIDSNIKVGVEFVENKHQSDKAPIIIPHCKPDGVNSRIYKIELNTNHPLYKNFIIGKEKNKEVMLALLTSLAISEINEPHSDNKEYIAKFRHDFSIILSQILS